MLAMMGAKSLAMRMAKAWCGGLCRRSPEARMWASFDAEIPSMASGVIFVRERAAKNWHWILLNFSDSGIDRRSVGEVRDRWGDMRFVVVLDARKERPEEGSVDVFPEGSSLDTPVLPRGLALSPV